MAYSSTKSTGDGVTTDFPVTFDYLDQDHVKVRVDKVFTTEVGSLYKATWLNSTTLRVDTVSGNNPAPNGAVIEFIRETPIDVPVVVFGGGASLSSENLNKNSEYLTFALQEASDTNQEFTKLYLGAFAVAPTTDNDGDTLQVGAVYYSTTVQALFYWTGSVWIIGESTIAAETFATAAGVSRDAAAASAAAALVSQNASAASQSAASTSASNAATSASNASASATAAASSASTASAAATSATGSAATASTQAGSASTSASSASTSASAASSSATSAAGSAASASASAISAAASQAAASASATSASASEAAATQQAGIATAAANSSWLSGRNVVINGNFAVNQRGVSNTVTLAAGNYGHDRWKAGSSGCTYTFSTVENVTTLNITAGSLVQVIEGANLFSGTHVLSFTGTAQGKIGTGPFGASGITGLVTGGTNLSIEFNTGTVAQVQLEAGSVVTPFERRPVETELELCKRYFEIARGGGVAYAGSGTGIQRFFLNYKEKRAVPSVSLTKIGGNINTGSPSSTLTYVNGALIAFTSTSASQEITVSATVDAEL